MVHADDIGGRAVPEHSAGRRLSLSEDERHVLDAEVAILNIWEKYRSTMPLQYVRAFLLVATKEGLGVNEYAKMLGLSLTTMSRHMSDIGDKDRYGEPGFGLVTAEIDARDSRIHRVFLTPKGAGLAKQLVHAHDAILRRRK